VLGLAGVMGGADSEVSEQTTDLLIEARVLRAGARTVFCEGDVLDSAGRAVCTARAVFKLIAL
jgi:acyl-coenzyme A thioesterase PaaI-like protein